MNLMGTIGASSRPAVPDVRGVAAALDLLAALGDSNPQETRKWLSDIQNAGDRNTKLLADIQHDLARLGDLKARESAVVANERIVDLKLKEWAQIRASWAEYEKTL